MLLKILMPFALLFSSGLTHAKHHHKHHHHVFRQRISRFDLCVANRENGQPGATTFNTINWHADNNYEGAFSWEPSKWAAGGGRRFAKHAYNATPQQQVAVFEQNGRNGEWTASNWPTIPPCR